MLNIFDPTIENLRSRKNKLERLQSLFFENQDALSRADLIFIVQESNINHDAIINDLVNMDLTN